MTQNGALPLYLQISELLIRDVASGRLMDGERLPPEREMAASLGIAVGTLRQALKVLVDKGLIDSIQGSGNYIRARTDATSVYALLRIELLTGGGLPTARVLAVDCLPKDPALPAFGRSPDGHRIRRLRYLSGQVAAVEEIWLDASQTPRIATEDLSESLYLFYRQKLNLWITRAEDRIGLGRLPDWAPPEFPHAHGTPLPLITRVSWAQDNTPVEASFTWFDPDKVAYVARLK
ncbi:MAG: GntR family transcriptional regulator [Rhodobacteraceae bacterium]|nr:GntR family transcriptional regulator [Paracoccaceae bacterium]MCF8516116.1 GntR family transcriptional regulator [Paracoccaceae bacterium]MCF8520567.1 GntR family transcriptional regulator [Paracoccaceae bacterium]